jgi:glycosyltransferase involved in cell wall biosynthesis
MPQTISGGPRVSVIIPAFNAERYIRDTLESVLAQTYPDVEVIVVDDGSTDGTAACVRAYGDRVRYLHQENSGGCGSPRNAGMKAATGELYAFLDSDDLLAPDRLATEVDFLARNPEVGMIFSNYRDFQDNRVHDGSHFEECPLLSRRLGPPPTAVATVLDSAASTELLLTENFGSSSPMIRRAAAESVGGYDETLRASEDYDFQYRVALRYPIAVIPQIGWYKRLHAGSMSSQTPNIFRHKILTRSRLLAAERVPRRRRILKRRLATFHAVLAYYYTGRDNALAVRHAFTSLRFRPRQHPKLWLRLALDFLGRDTNAERTVTGS